jgi:hypothetical protein
VVVTAAVWATCTKQHAVYKEATRKGGLSCFGAQFPALSDRPACRTQRGSPRAMMTSKNTPALHGVWLPATRIEARLHTGISRGVTADGKALEDGRGSPVC